jgi:hypothetical protein
MFLENKKSHALCVRVKNLHSFETEKAGVREYY